MARALLAASLFASACGARVTGGAPWAALPSETCGAPWAALPSELAWHVLGHVPWPWRLAVTVSRKVQVWSSDDGIVSHLHGNLTDVIMDVKLAPGGDWVMTTGNDGSVVVRRGRSWPRVHDLRLGPARVLDSQIFADGERVAVLDDEMGVTVWNTVSGVVHRQWRVASRHRCIRVLPQGDRVATGVANARGQPAAMWHVGRTALLYTFSGTESALEVSPCGARLITLTGLGGGISIWNAADGCLLRQLNVGPLYPHIAVSEGASRLAWPFGRLLFVWDGDLPSTIRLSANLGACAYALLPGGDRVVALTRSEAAIWDVRSRRRLFDLQGGALSNPLRVVVSPGGDAVAACGMLPPLEDEDYHTVWATMWDASSGRRLQDLMGADHGGDPFRCGLAIGGGGSAADWLAGPHGREADASRATAREGA